MNKRMPLFFMIIMFCSTYAFSSSSYNSAFGLIEGYIEYNINRCSKEFPLVITFKNNTSMTIEAIRFEISARIPGRSTNVVADDREYTENKYGDGSYRNIPYQTSCDKIIKPNEQGGLCYKVPELTTREDPSNLEWKINIVPKSIKWEVN